jgi:folate-binding protein YgfZ
MLTRPTASAGYDALRRSAAVATVPRSLIVLEGSDAFDFLQRMSTNDFRNLADGGSCRTVIVNEKGRVLDVVTVVKAAAGAIVVGSPGSSTTLAEWFDRFIIMDDVRISLRAECPALIAVIGPDAPATAAVLGVGMIVAREDLGRIPCCLLLPGELREGATPAPLPDGFDRLPRADAGTLDAARVEECVPVRGRELGPDVNALEAGLKPYISFSKGCYIGQEVIARLDTYKKLRTIIARFGIDAPDGTEPSPGSLLQDGREAGRITSTAYSSINNGWIGLGFRQIRSADVGYELCQPGGKPSLPCRCIQGLPPGYEEYEIEQ